MGARHKPVVLQNRFYGDSGYDFQLRDFCLKHGISYQSFWTITANPHVLRDQHFQAIAASHHMTREQTLFKYLIDLGHQPLTGCKTAKHVAEAVLVGAFDFRLSEDEVGVITKILLEKNAAAQFCKIP